MNQIKVPIPGRTNEKLLFVKDVSNTCNLREMLITHGQMADFKDEMMQMLDSYAKNTQKLLRSMDNEVTEFGKEKLYNCEC